MKTVAELFDDLLQVRKNSEGETYTFAELSRLTGGDLDSGYLSKLRSGKILNPGRNTLLHLCAIFRVPPEYFFPELEEHNYFCPGSSLRHADFLSVDQVEAIQPQAGSVLPVPMVHTANQRYQEIRGVLEAVLNELPDVGQGGAVDVGRRYIRTHCADCGALVDHDDPQDGQVLCNSCVLVAAES